MIVGGNESCSESIVIDFGAIQFDAARDSTRIVVEVEVATKLKLVSVDRILLLGSCNQRTKTAPRTDKRIG